MAGRSRYIALAVAVFLLGTTLSFGGIRVGPALAGEAEIRIGLLYANSAPQAISMLRDGGGKFSVASQSGNTFLLELDNQGSHSYQAIAAKNRYVLTGFDNYQQVFSRAGELSSAGLDVTTAWRGEWQLWLSGNASDIGRIAPGAAGDLTPAGIRLVASGHDLIVAAGNNLRFVPHGEVTRVEQKNRVYRGIMEVTLGGNGLQLVNELPLEQYLLGVVPYEMSPNWEVEALKAQAVAARTFALRSWYKFSQYGFNLDDTTASQVYYGYSAAFETARIVEAINSTAGEVIYYNNSLIEAVYHSNCGGHTDDAKNLWGSRVPYLLGRECGFCADTPRHQWQYDTVLSGIGDYGRQGLRDLLLDRGLIPAGFVIDEVEFLHQVTESGFERRVDIVILTDPLGTTRQISGSQFYSVLAANPGTAPTQDRVWSRFFDVQTDASVWLQSEGTSTLRHGGLSQMYARTAAGTVSLGGDGLYALTASGVQDLPARPQAFSFFGGGWGHGVGMCQWGARGMAQQGYKYDEILKYYYSGIEFSR